MKQLFYFLKMQFVVKYLLNPGCKHSISASNFVEASILDKSAPLHDGKIQIFSRGRVPLHQIFNFYISLRPCYQSAQKSTQMLFSVSQICRNAEYSWWDQAHSLQGPLVHEWQTVSQAKQTRQQFCQIHSANMQFFDIDKV